MAFCHSVVFKFQPLNCYLKSALEPFYSPSFSFSPFVSFCLQCVCVLSKNVAFRNRHNLRRPLVLPQDNHCAIYLLTVCVLAFVFIFPQTSVILVLALCLPLQELSEFILLTSFHTLLSLSLSLALSRSLRQGALGNCAFIHQFAPLCPLYVFLCHTHKHTHTGVLLSEVEISQSIRESPFSVIRQTEGAVLHTLVHMSLLPVFILFSGGRLHLFSSLTVMHSHSEPSSHTLNNAHVHCLLYLQTVSLSMFLSFLNLYSVPKSKR